jgi:hypothetical protein
MTRLALMLIVLVTGALSAAYGLAWVLVSHDGPSTPAAAADPAPVSAQAIAVARIVHRYHHHPAATHAARRAGVAVAVAHPVVAAETRPSHHATARPAPPAAPAKVVTHAKPAPAPKPKPAPGKHHHGHHQHGTGGGGDGNGGNGNGSVIGGVVSAVTGVLSVLTG